MRLCRGDVNCSKVGKQRHHLANVITEVSISAHKMTNKINKYH